MKLFGFSRQEVCFRRDVTHRFPHATPVRAYWCTYWEDEYKTVFTITIFGLRFSWWSK